MCDLISQCRPDMEIIVELAQSGLEAEAKTCEDVVALFKRWGFRPYVIANEYGPKAYIHQRYSRPKLVERIPMDESQLADVVFSRRQSDIL
jgi:hypothetical protein